MALIKPRAPKKKFGTVLSDYDKALETARVKSEEYGVGEAGPLSEESILEREKATIQKPAAMADEDAIKRKKKKEASRRRRSGRASTILSETLG